MNNIQYINLLDNSHFLYLFYTRIAGKAASIMGEIHSFLLKIKLKNQIKLKMKFIFG